LACVEGILRLFTNFYLYRELLIFLRNYRDCDVVDQHNARKWYAVIEKVWIALELYVRINLTSTLDCTRNIFWLASWFSKINKPNKHYLGNLSVIAGVRILTQFRIFILKSNILIWTSTYGYVRYKRNIQNRNIQSKRVLGCIKYTHSLEDHNKVTQ
jgi:hypothetical protein